MTDQKTAQQAFREQYKVAENFAGGAWRAWVDFAASTTEFTFDAFEKSMNYNLNARAQADKFTTDTMLGFRRLYEDGWKMWQGYVQGVGEIVNRAAKN